jgi:alkylation response protein AidB-like acyl-CoA dehydrogenase
MPETAQANTVIDTRILDKQHDLAAFRAALRAWLKEAVPADAIDRIVRAHDEELVEIQRWWMGERQKVGLGMGHWPKEYGGAGLGLAHEVILAEEFARANAPIIPAYTVSFNNVPSTLFAWGSEAQKRRYLPGIAAGEIWCQGFSEPGAGSDLASLRTRAERDGDHYVLNGQKIWSSFAMHAGQCIMLVRTGASEPKHSGLSFLIMDMKSPGLEVRPIRQITARSEFAELFLTNVRVPVENLVGPENQGWKVAQSTLSAERGLVAFEFAERNRHAIERFYFDAVRNEAAWLKDAQLHREFVDLILEFQAHRRQIRTLLATEPSEVGILPPVIKLHGTGTRQRISALMAKLTDLEGNRYEHGHEDVFRPPMFTYLSSFGWTISAGTNEIMRNVIAERGLGMPR